MSRRCPFGFDGVGRLHAIDRRKDARIPFAIRRAERLGWRKMPHSQFTSGGKYPRMGNVHSSGLDARLEESTEL